MWVAQIESAVCVKFGNRPWKGRAGDRSKLDHVATGPTQIFDGSRKVPLGNGPPVAGNRDGRVLIGRSQLVSQYNAKSCCESTGQERVEALMQIADHSLVVQKVSGLFWNPSDRYLSFGPFRQSLDVVPMPTFATARITFRQSRQVNRTADPGRFAGALKVVLVRS